jgi:tRNA (cytidine/uridine-2'-O-)-methyltransferase
MSQGNHQGNEATGADSVSRAPKVPQPTETTVPPSTVNGGQAPGNEALEAHHTDSSNGTGRHPPAAHVVLYQPEIPQNTGNIGRTCVAVGAKLWIVRPAGFRIDDAKLRRAGLDYWQHLDFDEAVNWEDLVGKLAPRRMFFFSRFAKRTIWDVSFRREDVFVFGRETSGLPPSILDPNHEHALRLPTSPFVRSLNLATTVGIVLYEQQRQLTLQQANEARVVVER